MLFLTRVITDDHMKESSDGEFGSDGSMSFSLGSSSSQSNDDPPVPCYFNGKHFSYK